ncbi:MAG TPA: hypothetical protein VGI39_34270 [Polyangiaceae bacterium]|jgi:hypothetical protein
MATDGRDRYIQVRLSQTEERALLRLCGAKGLSKAGVVRQLVMDAAKRLRDGKGS